MSMNPVTTNLITTNNNSVPNVSSDGVSAPLATSPTELPTGPIAEAYEACEGEILEAAKTECPPVLLDVPYAVRVMTTISGNIAPYRARLATLPDFDMDAVNKLELRTRALTYAHARHAWTLESAPALEVLVEEVKVARRVLNTELELMQVRGLIPQDAVKLQGTTKHLAMAADVNAICSVFRENWAVVSAEIGNKVSHVSAAMASAEKLINAVSRAAEVKEKAKGTSLMRAAAWKLAYASFKEVERGIAYFRFHQGDADVLVPSVFDRSSSGRRDDAETKVEPGIPADGSANPLAPTPAGGEPTKPIVPVAPILPQKPFDE